METEKTFKYYAFISYKREDEEWAKWLQHKLEHYKLPSNLNGRTDLPKEIRPIFKDTSELNPGNLPQQIHYALEQSKFLIVICSPRSAKSEWVNKEVETFMGMGRTDKIIPFIIDGKAFAIDLTEECFPKAIRNLPAEQEILGANIGEMGRDAAAVKVVAQMFGLKFDELWQRHEREQRKRRIWIIAASITGFIIMAGVAGWIWRQNVQLKKKDWKMMENQSRFMAEKAIHLIDNGKSLLAQRILLEVLPKDLSHPEKPYTTEVERALRYAAANHNTYIISKDEGYVTFASFSPDGSRIIISQFYGPAIVLDAETGTPLFSLNEQSYNNQYAKFNPDGTTIISTYEDQFKIWDADNGQLLKTIETGSWINAIAFSSDGQHILTASPDGKIRTWNAKTGELLRTFKVHNGDIFYASFNPEGTLIATATDDDIVRIWDAKTGNLLKKLEGHQFVIPTVVFSPDGSRIASASYDHTIRIWDVSTGDLLQVLKVHDDRRHNKVFSAFFNPNGTRIVSTHEDNAIRIWDVETGDLLRTLEGHHSEVYSAVFSPDGTYLVSSSDNTVRTWNVEPCVPNTTIKGEEFFARDNSSVIINPVSHSIVYPSRDNNVKIWDYETNTELLTLEGYTEAIGTIVFSPDGTRIAAVSLFDTLMIWDAQTGKLLQTENGKNVAFSPDGKLIASESSEQILRIWNAETADLITKIDISVLKTHGGSVVFSPDGSQIIYCCDRWARIWDVASGKELATFNPGGKWTHSVFYHPDGTFILVGTDYDAELFDAETGDELKNLEPPEGYTHSAAFNPDGSRVITTSVFNIRIWDTETGDTIQTLKGHTQYVNIASFSPDGLLIVSASDDNTIRIWDAENGQLLQTLTEQNNVCSVAFTPDGMHIISIDYNGLIKIWDFPPLQELIDQTRERFKDRPLTDEERRMYYLE